MSTRIKHLIIQTPGIQKWDAELIGREISQVFTSEMAGQIQQLKHQTVSIHLTDDEAINSQNIIRALHSKLERRSD